MLCMYVNPQGHSYWLIFNIFSADKALTFSEKFKNLSFKVLAFVGKMFSIFQAICGLHANKTVCWCKVISKPTMKPNRDRRETSLVRTGGRLGSRANPNALIVSRIGFALRTGAFCSCFNLFFMSSYYMTAFSFETQHWFTAKSIWFDSYPGLTHDFFNF